MIARLTGILAETAADHAVIDVAGVGYLVQASARTLEAIGPVGGEVRLFTEMQVREDSMTLFGFGSAGERDWFRLLTGVQGVGGKVALAILSALPPDELHRAVASGDAAMVARANGVGPKLAARIVNELKGKAGAAPRLLPVRRAARHRRGCRLGAAQIRFRPRSKPRSTRRMRSWARKQTSMRGRLRRRKAAK